MRKPLLRLIPVLTLALFLSGSAFADGAVFSLLIGCDRFVTMPDTTPASETNTARMAEILTAYVPGMTEPKQAANGVGDLETLEALISGTFAEAGEDSVSWIYISTHGLQENGKTFLLLSDGEREIRLDAETLKTLTDRVPGKIVLAIDACHSGGLIGKGTDGYIRNVFAGEKYIVLTSCGGEEDSWLWNSSENPETGAGYFTAALRAIAGKIAKRASDRDRDGILTLTETRLALEQALGASTVRTYPEEDDFPLFDLSWEETDDGLERVEFSVGLAEPGKAEIPFSYLLRRETELLYQIVRRQDGKWDFDGTAVLREGRTGMTAPGFRTRSVTLNCGADGGYALIQLIRITDGIPDLCLEHPVCVPASEGDPELRVDLFLPEYGSIEPGEEMSFAIRCALPCGLNVSVTDEEGNIVRHLMTGEGTRPQNADPEGMFLCWNGRDGSGNAAPEGVYTVRVRTGIGGIVYECESEAFRLEKHNGPL